MRLFDVLQIDKMFFNNDVFLSLISAHTRAISESEKILRQHHNSQIIINHYYDFIIITSLPSQEHIYSNKQEFGWFDCAPHFILPFSLKLVLLQFCFKWSFGSYITLVIRAAWVCVVPLRGSQEGKEKRVGMRNGLEGDLTRMFRCTHTLFCLSTFNTHSLD